MFRAKNNQHSDLVIDPGSVMTKVYYRERRLWCEPSSLICTSEGKLLEIGERAVQLSVGNIAGINLIWPIRYSQLANPQALVAFIQSLISRVTWLDGSSLPINTKIVFPLVKQSRSQVQARAWRHVASKLSNKVSVLTLSELLDLGCRFFENNSAWLIDIGAWQISASLIQKNKLVEQVDLPYGLNQLYKLVELILNTHGLAVNRESQTRIVQEVLNFSDQSRRSRKLIISCKSLTDQRQLNAVVSQDWFVQDVSLVVGEWLAQLRYHLDQAPIYLTGGAVKLHGFDQLMTRAFDREVVLLRYDYLAKVVSKYVKT